MTGSTATSTEQTSENATPQQTLSISVGRSRSRNRSRHRRSHRSRRNRFFGSSKIKESNCLAAVANMAVVVLVCTAIADPQWFYIYGGGCRDQNEHPINYLGMNQFIVSGQFDVIDSGSQGNKDILTRYVYGTTHSDVLIDCVSKSVVDIMHVILAICFLSVLLSLLAFLLDLSGSTNKVLKIIREFAILSILTVIFCVMVNGFCYWATEHLEELQKMRKLHVGSKVMVEFSVSFYLIAAAGAMSVIATACSLLRKPNYPENRYHQYDRLSSTHNNDDDIMGLLEEEPQYVAPPPPPPYSP